MRVIVGNTVYDSDVLPIAVITGCQESFSIDNGVLIALPKGYTTLGAAEFLLKVEQERPKQQQL